MHMLKTTLFLEMASELAITMQEWGSGTVIESAMKMQNHCSTMEKKQKITARNYWE